MSQQKPYISFIIVNYKSKKYLQQCLKSVENFMIPILKHNIEIIIINNDSNNLNLKNDFSFNYQIIENKENLGFSQAINQGGEIAQGEFLFLLNPDSLFKDDSFTKLFDYLNTTKQPIDIIGVKILNAENNNLQKWSYGEKTSLSKIFFKNKFKEKNYVSDNSNQITPVDWVTGAGMLIRKNLFNKLNGFDENFFMYFEDQDFCLRAKKINAQTIFFPFTKIHHWGGKSWQKQANQKKEYYKSQDYFFQKHLPIWQGKVLKVIRKILK